MRKAVFVRPDGTAQCRYVRVVDHTPTHWRVEACQGNDGTKHAHETAYGSKSGLWVDGITIEVVP